MKRAERIALKTMAIKSRVYNQIRTALFKKDLESISESDKIELFNQWFVLNNEAHQELNAYKSKRQYKAEISSLREERAKAA